MSLATCVLLATVVAFDPHPFAGADDPPMLALASEPLISGATATTIPPTVTIPSDRDAGSTPTPSTVPLAPTPITAAPVVVPPPSTAPPIPAVSAPSPPATVARFVSAVVPVYPQEGDTRAVFSLYATTELGTPRVVLTTAVHGDWVQVLLPLRPNGSTGWVRAADVQLSTVADRIDVDLAARTLTWSRGGSVLLQTAAGIGAPATPTPIGTFFVTDVLPFDPAAGRGLWVLALNGHSDAYLTFEGGDARIAIHGTSDPASVGAARSNGCVRVGDGPLDQLRARVLPGTPVVIR